MNFKKLLVAASLIATASTANAALTTISGSSLQNALDNITDGSFYDVNSGQYNPDEIWNVTSTGGSINRLLFEFAGFENSAKFGIYDINNISNTLELFGGSSCGTADTSCTSDLNFSTLRYFSTHPTTGASINAFQATLTDNDIFAPTSTVTAAMFSSSNFGYYLDSGDGIFYSQKGLNTELGQGTEADHMVTYRGDDVTQIDIAGGTNYDTFSSGEYILAWEDLKFQNADKDYTDFVVLVESVEVVPEPAALAFIGLGLAGLSIVRRKRKS